MLPDVRPRTAPEAPDRWILWVDKLLPGPDGDEVLSVGRDVTESQIIQARLHESEQRFRLAMTNAPVGMAIIDMDGRYRQVNPAMCRLLGRSEEALLELSPMDVTHPDDLDVGRDEVARVMAGEITSFSIEKRYLRSDGTPFWGQLNLSLMRDDEGRPRYRIAQVVDITDRVEREATLRHVADVEREAAAQLRHFDEVKNAFLSAVSHELRTPLTVVRGMATTLQRMRGRLDDQTRTDLEDAIVDHAERLGELLEDLLDVDRLARGTLSAHPARFDVAEKARAAVAASSVAGRTVVDAPEHLDVAADPVQVERILVNLLENVAKYAPNGAVRLRLSGVATGGFRLEVHDEGPGIRSEELERVFEPFHRGDPGHPQPGTGIGLALVAEFARLHGGRAWAQDSADGGHVVVEIPDHRPR